MECALEALRDDLWLLRTRGSRNPGSLVFRQGSRLFVTDPGVAWRSRGKNADLERLRRSLRAEVAGIFLTHSHPDHVGNIPGVAGDDTPIYLHPRSFWSLRSPGVLLRAENGLTRSSPFFPGWQVKLYPAFARLFYGPGTGGHRRRTPRGGRYLPLPAEPLACDGYTVHAVPTPGHVPGEVSFWIPEHRLLACGDLIPNTHIGRDHVPSLYMPECNVYDAIESLGRVVTLEPEILVPAHGEPVRGREAILERAGGMTILLRRLIGCVRDVLQREPHVAFDDLVSRVFAGSGLELPPVVGRIERRSMVFSAVRDAPRR